MIPTVTYEQVRIEQEAGLAGLEVRRHAHAANEARDHAPPTERLHTFVPGGLRTVLVTASLVAAALVMLIR